MEEIVISVEQCNRELKDSIKYKIPYISNQITEVIDEGTKIIVKGSYSSKEETERKLNEFVKQMEEEYMEVKAKTIFSNESKDKLKEIDIYQELLDKEMVVEYGNGLIGFGGEFLEKYNSFEHVFQSWGKKLGAKEYVYPDFIDIRSLNKYKYLSQFPNHIMFASHLKEDIRTIYDFSETISTDMNCLNDQYIDRPEYINKTSVCVHVYKQYEDKKIDLEHPIVISSLGKCKRFESLNMSKIERLMDFSMHEIVFIGSEEFVLKKREEVIELAKEFISELDLTANIKTSNDPFFTSEYKSKAMLQKKFKLKYELNVLLPYNNREISVGSFNYHGTYFSDAFNIRDLNNKPVYTGCVGFGVERFVYAYLSQKGFIECK